jgi:NifB/MoaA-like Fe-S oxidoreductase
MTKSDDKFARRARDLFDASVDELDASTRSALNQGRQRALAELQGGSGHWMRWVPAAGVAAAVVVAVMVALPGPNGGDQLPATIGDMEILLDEDSIDMFEELEFYSWIDLAEQSDDVG